MSDIAQHLAVSGKIDFEDLDFETARKVGLTEKEVETLLYFADIESQTVHYFLEVAKLKVARDPELLTFLTMWNYEEYFHSYAITHFLRACGVDLESATQRAQTVRAGARFKAKFEDFMQGMIARTVPKSFVALWMFWGSLQECLTTQAYEELATTTKNPVLAELCRRIAKQERRHFAYYFGQAKKKLEGQVFAQRMTRAIAKAFYAPVGGGVKTDEEGARLVAQLFPGDRIFEVMGYIERKMALLPGMEGLDCCTRWAAKVQPMLPPETRAASIPALAA
ncbi:MAG: acyl-ACP desaturase [Deltaproteobacteria bacterium]|nr:acyl-ACP desaturase [Deltaproteobacteria bacterium]MCW5808363.1 acyl-ACP desaturase [Deltaproteobacteria bacterium]